MFERYTEPARRTLFFARYEASQFRSLSRRGVVRRSILLKKDFTLAGLRDQVSAASQTAREAGPRDRTEAVFELEQVKKLVDRLADSLSDQEAAKKLIAPIRFYMERLQERFRP
jgi:hypothetical protein